LKSSGADGLLAATTFVSAGALCAALLLFVVWGVGRLEGWPGTLAATSSTLGVVILANLFLHLAGGCARFCIREAVRTTIFSVVVIFVAVLAIFVCSLLGIVVMYLIDRWICEIPISELTRNVYFTICIVAGCAATSGLVLAAGDRQDA